MITYENEQVLKANHLNVLEFIRNKEESWLNESIKLSSAKNGQHTLSMQINNQSLYFHSQYDPIQEAERFVVKFEDEFKQGQHVLFYGFGLGYYVDAFFRRFGKISFSIFDPYPAAFYQALANMNAALLHLDYAENIYLENHVDYYMDNFASKNKDALIVVHPAYERIFNEEYKVFLETYKAKVINMSLMISVNHSFEKLWVANSEANFQKVLSTPSMLREKKGFLNNQTVIMVSAGPSLQDEIENLRMIKENGLAYIFTVGSAYRALIANGIYPDAVCSYDPGLDNYEVFGDMVDQGITNIPLVFGSSVGFKTLEVYPGPMLHMITSQDCISAFYLGETEFVGANNEDVVADAPTIAVLTLELLHKLGCSQIILAGQNFAYRNNQYYSEGISYSFRGTYLTDADNRHAEEVDCVDGGKVRTVAAHSAGRKLMESYISQMPNMKVINTTRGGAAIKGAEYMFLKDVIDKYLQKSVVEKDWFEIPPTQYNIESIGAQHKKLSLGHGAIEQIVKSIVKTLKRLETAVSLQDFRVIQKIFAKFESLNVVLYENCYYQIIIQPMIRVQYALLQQVLPSIQRAQSLIDKAKLIIQHYGTYIHNCQIIIRDNEPFYQVLDNSVNQYLKQVSE